MAQFDITDDRVRPVVFAALQRDLQYTEPMIGYGITSTRIEQTADAVCKALEDLQDVIDREFDYWYKA